MSKKDLIDKVVDKELKVIWKDIYIDNQLTHYQISNTGLVKNKNTNKNIITHKRYGYLKANIYCNHKMYTRSVHRLVAIAFIPNPENKSQVNHKDGNKLNNKVENLEWVTAQENVIHGRATGLIKYSNSTKLSEETIHIICKMLEDKIHPREISSLMNIRESIITGIIYQGNWKYISSQYKIPKMNEFSKLPHRRKPRKYTEEQIHVTCKLLETGKQPKEVSEILNVPVSLPNYIKYYNGFRNICINYNIPKSGEIPSEPRKNPPNSKLYSHELIHEICKLLSMGTDHKDIAEKTGAPKDLVYDINRKKAWTTISKLYF